MAEALVEQAQAAGVELYLVVGGLRTGSGAALEPTTRRYILEHWQAVTEATGQPFTREGALPDGFVYDTEPACRAIVTARSLAPDCAWKLLGLIQRAFYVEGRDVTLASVLVELAEEAGIPRIEFAGAFDRAEQHAATAADFTWVQDLVMHRWLAPTSGRAMATARTAAGSRWSTRPTDRYAQPEGSGNRQCPDTSEARSVAEI